MRRPVVRRQRPFRVLVARDRDTVQRVRREQSTTGNAEDGPPVEERDQRRELGADGPVANARLLPPLVRRLERQR